MAITKHFLGVSQPGLVSTVDFLIRKYVQRSVWDLDQVLLVTTGSRAGRRLGELLFARSQLESLSYLPPEMTTVGRLPEMLYRTKRPFASEWVQQMAWANAIRLVDRFTRNRVFPHYEARTEGDHPTGGLLELGRLLQATYRELAAERLSFAHVAETASSLASFPESKRWQAMAVMQEQYLRILDEEQLWDRQTARLVAIDHEECECERDIVLVATADLNRTIRGMLSQVEGHVTTLIHAPREWEDRFDESGTVRTAAWQDAKVPLGDNQITIVDGFREQAAAVIGILGELGDRYACDEISIGCPDQGLLPCLERALAAVGIRGRWGPGRNVSESGPYRLLQALREWLATERFDALADFLRHADVAVWLHNREVPAGWESQLDDYRVEHLPLRFPDPWLGSSKGHGRLKRACDEVAGLCRPLRTSQQPLATWSKRLAEFLAAVYADSNWSGNSPHQRATFAACQVLQAALWEFAATPRDWDASMTASSAIQSLLEQVSHQTLPDLPDPDAIELLGWLELPLETAPVLIVTGMSEGVVPPSNRADLFLPDSLRRHLGIEDEAHRYARDVYALGVLARSHPGLPLVVSRNDMQGDPVKPSRLLFAEQSSTISHRWLRLLEHSQSGPQWSQQLAASLAGGGDLSQRRFGFEVPRPVRLAEPISRMRITDFKTYLACPYRFYLQRVLGLQAMADDEVEMDGRLFGTVMHDIMNDFGLGAAKDSTSAAEVSRDLRAHLKRQILRRFGRELSPALRVQREQMQMRLEAFATKQAARRNSGWRIAHVEEPAEIVAEIAVAEGTIQLSGRIDRIDVHEESGAYAVLDYKTSDAGLTPEKVHQKGPVSAKRWIDLQLPLYRMIAHAMGVGPIEEVGYVLLPKKLDEIGFRVAKWTEHDYEQAERAAQSVVSRVLQQKFWPPGEAVFAPGDEFAGILMSDVPERPKWGESEHP